MSKKLPEAFCGYGSPQNFYHGMLGRTHFFHLVQHPDEAPVFLALRYHFLLNFDKVVPEMKQITI